MGFENLPLNASLRTFKRGVTPSWEHPANSNGGKWIVVIPKLMSVGVFNEVLAAVISAKMECVNGVLLAKKRREDLVNVWVRAAPDDDDLEVQPSGPPLISQPCDHALQSVKEHIVERLAKNLGIEADISFKKHGCKKAVKSARGAGCNPPGAAAAGGGQGGHVETEQDEEHEATEQSQESKGYLRQLGGWLSSKFGR